MDEMLQRLHRSGHLLPSWSRPLRPVQLPISALNDIYERDADSQYTEISPSRPSPGF